ncbi:hypothetical protein IEO21_02404 [Rhodonia placenta]|uniref:Uncharacterized protein n=1 Tax=Rhodonia placenta TaxID=104341 RepID=A0A8H7P823_9APHY|nr:hypothetical protein IEO21_02404 [Postia placenta]
MRCLRTVCQACGKDLDRCLKGGRRCWEYVRLPNKGGRVVSAGLDCHLLKVNCGEWLDVHIGQSNELLMRWGQRPLGGWNQ